MQQQIKHGRTTLLRTLPLTAQVKLSYLRKLIFVVSVFTIQAHTLIARRWITSQKMLYY